MKKVPAAKIAPALDPKADTKLPIIQKAAIALFVERGVSATTIREIAALAEVAEGTLYRHYGSKEELALDILQTHLTTFTEFIERRAAEGTTLLSRLERLAGAFAEAYEENEDIARFVLFSHAADMNRLPRDMTLPFDVVLDLIKKAQADSEVPPEADPTLLAAMVLGSLTRVLYTKAVGTLKGDLRSRSVEIARRLRKMMEVR